MAFCLFGPGIPLMPFFAKSACEALESFPMKVTTISSIAPKHAKSHESSGSHTNSSGVWSLADFSEPKLSTEKYLLANFVTPVHILSNGNTLKKEDITFDHLILSILNRLRDLKRCYGENSDIGKIPGDCSELAKNVTIAQNRLYFSRKKRFSRRQEQDIWLKGLKGKLYFTGPFQPFFRLLKISEITRIGKGASEGNGLMHFSVSDTPPE